MAIITRFALLLGALLVACSSLGLAQESETINVIGSGITNALVMQLADSSANALDVSDLGSARGIDLFCNGDIDLATSTREMTDAEATICAANEVNYSQLLVGHQIIAFAAHPDAPDACLSASNLDDMFKPTASHQLIDWSFESGAHAELPLTLILPAQDQIAYAILDNLVVGDGLRLDGADATADSVAETPGALAVVQWSSAMTDDEGLKLLQMRDANSGQCLSPSVEAVENGQYAAAQSLYVYVNRVRLEASQSLMPFLEYAVAPANAGLVEAAGITPPSASLYELNAELLADAEAMPLLSGDASAFRIPPSLAGAVRIVGAANAHQPLRSLGEQMTRSHPQLQIDFDLAGSGAGITALCAEEADIAVLDDQLSTDECAGNGVVALPFPIGALATVLVGNAGDEFSACLTSEQIVQMWRAESAEVVEQWSDLGEDFPQTPLMLFGLSLLDAHTDILLQAAGDLIPPVRRDTEQDYDPNYRAAAVANVPGALTYMTWSDYEGVLAKEQANVRAVAVDGGAGCVAPTDASIGEGAYALSRAANLLVREAALADVNIQSFLWTLYGDDSWSQVTREGFIGISALELPVLRRELQVAFRTAEAAYPQPDAAADSE
ncbi:MAG: substrate-binding domain-containing protein [Chloroflexi bacterium]|nr:substrate-binding domain-containing protein [Chloroflexota bacterium]